MFRTTILTMTALLGMAACASNKPAAEPEPRIYYFGAHYYHVPPGYTAHCHSRRLTVSTPSGQLQGAAAVDALNGATGGAIQSNAALDGQPVFALQGSRCHYGQARHGHSPRLVARGEVHGSSGLDANGRVRVDSSIDTGLGRGGLNGGIGGRAGGGLELP